MNRREFLKKSIAAAAVLRHSGGMAQSICPITIDRLTSSTSSFAGLGFLEALKAARRIGFAGIEILTFTNGSHSVGHLPGVSMLALNPEDRDRALTSVREFKHVTTHLPFYSVYMASKKEEIRNNAMAQLHTAIDDSAFWGASVATLHSLVAPGETYDGSVPVFISALRELGEHAASVHIRLGLETGTTGVANTVEQYLNLIREVNHPAVGGTIDTGHEKGYEADLGITEAQHTEPIAIERYREVLLRIVDGLGPKLFHFHVDDVNPGMWRDHRTLGTGIVDWKALVARLAKNGYGGVFALELEEKPVLEAAEQSRTFFKTVLMGTDQRC